MQCSVSMFHVLVSFLLCFSLNVLCLCHVVKGDSQELFWWECAKTQFFMELMQLLILEWKRGNFRVGNVENKLEAVHIPIFHDWKTMTSTKSIPSFHCFVSLFPEQLLEPRVSLCYNFPERKTHSPFSRSVSFELFTLSGIARLIISLAVVCVCYRKTFLIWNFCENLKLWIWFFRARITVHPVTFLERMNN
jgi:hypothetical protein